MKIIPASVKPQPDFTPKGLLFLSSTELELPSVGDPKTVQRIRNLHKLHSPDVHFLLQTKNPDSFVLDGLRDLCYDSTF